MNHLFSQGIVRALRVLLLAGLVGAGCAIPAQGALYGIKESYAILKANGGANTYYDGMFNTGNPDFNGANLGTFNPASNSLILNGAEVKTWKNGSGDVTGAYLAWRIWSGTPSGGFNETSLSWRADLGFGDQKWDNTGANINMLSGLGNGNYKLEIYFRASGNEGNVYDSNSGANYSANFSVVPEPTNVALGLFGGLALAGAACRLLRKLSCALQAA